MLKNFKFSSLLTFMILSFANMILAMSEEEYNTHTFHEISVLAKFLDSNADEATRKNTLLEFIDFFLTAEQIKTKEKNCNEYKSILSDKSIDEYFSIKKTYYKAFFSDHEKWIENMTPFAYISYLQQDTYNSEEGLERVLSSSSWGEFANFLIAYMKKYTNINTKNYTSSMDLKEVDKKSNTYFKGIINTVIESYMTGRDDFFCKRKSVLLYDFIESKDPTNNELAKLLINSDTLFPFDSSIIFSDDKKNLNIILHHDEDKKGQDPISIEKFWEYKKIFDEASIPGVEKFYHQKYIQDLIYFFAKDNLITSTQIISVKPEEIVRRNAKKNKAKRIKKREKKKNAAENNKEEILAKQQKEAAEKAEKQRLAEEKKLAREEAELKLAEERRIANEAKKKLAEERRIAKEAEQKLAEEKRLANERAKQLLLEEKRIAEEKAREEQLKPAELEQKKLAKKKVINPNKPANKKKKNRKKKNKNQTDKTLSMSGGSITLEYPSLAQKVQPIAFEQMELKKLAEKKISEQSTQAKKKSPVKNVQPVAVSPVNTRKLPVQSACKTIKEQKQKDRASGPSLNNQDITISEKINEEKLIKGSFTLVSKEDGDEIIALEGKPLDLTESKCKVSTLAGAILGKIEGLVTHYSNSGPTQLNDRNREFITYILDLQERVISINRSIPGLDSDVSVNNTWEELNVLHQRVTSLTDDLNGLLLELEQRLSPPQIIFEDTYGFYGKDGNWYPHN